MTPLALLTTALAVSVVQGWSLLWAHSAVKPVMVATLVYVALVSLLVHHAGHAVVNLLSQVACASSRTVTTTATADAFRVRYPCHVAFHAHQRLLHVAGAYTPVAP